MAVLSMSITRGKDGILRCTYQSELIADIVKALAADVPPTESTYAQGSVELSGGRTGRALMWYPVDGMLQDLGADLGVRLTADQSDLYEYRDGAISAINLWPLCAEDLRSGFTLLPNYPLSRVSLDAYAGTMKKLARILVANVAPVDITVRVVAKKPKPAIDIAANPATPE